MLGSLRLHAHHMTGSSNRRALWTRIDMYKRRHLYSCTSTIAQLSLTFFNGEWKAKLPDVRRCRSDAGSPAGEELGTFIHPSSAICLTRNLVSESTRELDQCVQQSGGPIFNGMKLVDSRFKEPATM